VQARWRSLFQKFKVQSSKLFKKLIQFLKVDIWQVQREDISPLRYLLYEVIKKVLLAVEYFTTKRMMDSAAALTYSTLLAIVPIMAVVFAIARGFGYNKYIETWFREALSSQPQVAEAIIGFVNSYLVHTKSGIFLGIGLLFMLWTVIMLISNIEKAFNDIWQVSTPRSIFRTITDYMAMFLLAPIIIVVTSGISIMMATFANGIGETLIVGPTLRFFLRLLPYIIMSGVFIALYVFMPNTKVKIKSAIIPGILAGVAMQGLQLVYIHSQIWVTGYNAIYGSFAALPLFMLWVQISWTICLFGAELAYTNQNLEKFAFRASTDDLSHRYRLLLSAYLMTLICRRFEEGKKPYTALELKLETNIPIRITHDLLENLTRVHLLSEMTNDEKGTEAVYQPAESTARLSVGMMIDRLEAEGKWKLMPDLQLFKSDELMKAIRQRKDYLQKQRDILFKDIPLVRNE
jgi:membrane protein